MTIGPDRNALVRIVRALSECLSATSYKTTVDDRDYLGGTAMTRPARSSSASSDP
jgi:hypothetical protein